MLLILCGYTATGKDTYQNMLLDRNPNLHRAVSHTTRPKRPNEQDGLEYYFIEESDFSILTIKGLMLETRNYNTIQNGKSTTWFYGLSKQEIVLHNNSVAIIDFDGTKEIVKNLGRDNVKIVYLYANDNTLYDRAKRRQDEMEEFKRRLQDDKIKFVGVGKYADLILNTECSMEQHIKNIEAIEKLLED